MVGQLYSVLRPKISEEAESGRTARRDYYRDERSSKSTVCRAVQDPNLPVGDANAGSKRAEQQRNVSGVYGYFPAGKSRFRAAIERVVGGSGAEHDEQQLRDNPCKQ